MTALESYPEIIKNPPTGWKRYSLVIYVTLAYVITWGLWLPVEWIAAQRGYVLPDPSTLSELSKTGFRDGTHVLLSIISMLTAGPLYAAIILLAFESGRTGLRDLWRGATHWRVGMRWYLIMLAILFVVYLPAVLFGIWKGPAPTASQILKPLVWFVPIFLYTLVASGLEEPGWRGYALPTLQARFNAKKASLILGVIWGVWHWPVFITVYTSALGTPGGSPLQAFFTALVQLLLYIFGAMVPEAFIYTWLYNRTRSVFLCILLHVFHNMAATYVEMILPSAASILPILGGVSQWAIAIILMRFFWMEAPNSKEKGE
jgi:uncharacterized protein